LDELEQRTGQVAQLTDEFHPLNWSWSPPPAVVPSLRPDFERGDAKAAAAASALPHTRMAVIGAVDTEQAERSITTEQAATLPAAPRERTVKSTLRRRRRSRAGRRSLAPTRR